MLAMFILFLKLLKWLLLGKRRCKPKPVALPGRYHVCRLTEVLSGDVLFITVTKILLMQINILLSRDSILLLNAQLFST